MEGLSPIKYDQICLIESEPSRLGLDEENFETFTDTHNNYSKNSVVQLPSIALDHPGLCPMSNCFQVSLENHVTYHNKVRLRSSIINQCFSRTKTLTRTETDMHTHYCSHPAVWAVVGGTLAELQ